MSPLNRFERRPVLPSQHPRPARGTIGAYFLQRDLRLFAHEMGTGSHTVREREDLANAIVPRLLVFCLEGNRYSRARFEALRSVYDLGGTTAVLGMLPPPPDESLETESILGEAGR